MKNIFSTLEKSFSYYLLFISFALAASTVFSKGNPEIFSSRIWIAVYFFSGLYLFTLTLLKFHRKEFINGAFFSAVTFLLVFYFFNTANFEYTYIQIKGFNESKEVLLENNRIMLLEHGFGDTGKLRNYEKAVFLSNGEEVTVELNKPLRLKNSTKLLLTGNGQRFLVTRSTFLLEILIAAVASVLLSFILIGREWKK